MDVKRQTTDEVQTREDDVRSMRALGEMHHASNLAERAIASGASLDQFQSSLLDELSSRNGRPVKQGSVRDLSGSRYATDGLGSGPQLGLSNNELQQFSLLRAIRALADPTDRRALDAAGFEFEVSRAYAQQSGKSPRGLFVPHEVLHRDLLKGAPGTGTNLVETQLLAGDFISLLRNKAVVLNLATVLNGLVGDVAVPRQTGGAAAGWVAENDEVGEQTPTFDQVSLTPRTCGTYTNLSRKMLIQSTPAAEQLVREDLAQAIAQALDYAAIAGPVGGAGPVGIINTAGIGAVTGGENGATANWGHVVALETMVALANADAGRMAYLTTPGIRGLFKGIEKVAGSGAFVWEDGGSQGNADGRLNGYPAHVTNQVPANLDKGTSIGVCHAILFGDWSSVLVGLWSGVDIVVDPYGQAAKGAVKVTALQDADIALRHPDRLAVMADALTT